MRHVVISSRGRPHVEHPTCWCRPRKVLCVCEHNCGEVLGHNLLDLYEDDQPRMSMFSEQYVRGMAPQG